MCQILETEARQGFVSFSYLLKNNYKICDLIFCPFMTIMAIQLYFYSGDKILKMEDVMSQRFKPHLGNQYHYFNTI